MNHIRGPSIMLVAGVDEAGRGPLAGPVIASAVILDREVKIKGLADSKTLTAKNRTRLAGEIKQKALDWAIARAEHHEIDRLNILQASLLAMQRAIYSLKLTPDQILVDGNHAPATDIPVEAVIKGDQTIPEISAASILAKVCRDEEMHRMDSLYPGYGFAAHKGYPTRMHLDALKKLGACEIHRRSYGPVRSICE